jgi:ATP-dependent DNA helicase PIF1
MRNKFPFGGKTIVLGGNFRQVTPVVAHSYKTNIIENSIKSGKLWREFEILKLYINMCADLEEKAFAEWVLKMGNGELKVEFGEDIIEITPECICKEDLIDEMHRYLSFCIAAI